MRRKIFLFQFLSVLFISLSFQEEKLRVPEIELFDLDNELIAFSKIKDKALLLLFFDPLNTYDKAKLIYAQVLYHKYGSGEIDIIAICIENENACRELYASGKFSFSFVFDKSAIIQGVFSIKKCCGGTILADREKIIRFRSSQLLNIENLRQLVEKEIYGRIVHDLPVTKKHSNQQIRQKLANMAFLDIKSGTIKDIRDLLCDNYLVMTFFSGLCPNCKSGVRVDTLRKLEKALKVNQMRGNLIVIFPQPFSERDLNEWEKLIPMPFDKYISSEDIFSEEEKYITDPSKKTEPFTIVLDKQSQIIYMEGRDISEEYLQNIILNSLSKKERTK